MGKMKDVAIKQQEDQEQEFDVLMMEEAHYIHTMNAFVELIVVYGYDKVIGDLRIIMGNKAW
jgi:hypothetical protein